MNTIKKLAIFSFFLFIVLAFIWAIFMPRPDIKKEITKTLEQQKQVADLSFEGVTFSESLASQKFWELSAEKALMNNSSGIARLSGTKGTFFDNNQPAMSFLAPKAIWDMKQKEIQLSEPVGYDSKNEQHIQPIALELQKLEPAQIMKNYSVPEGLRLKSYWIISNKLRWKLSNKKLEGNEGAIFCSQDILAGGPRLEGSANLKEIVLSGSPKAIITPKGKKAFCQLGADAFLLTTSDSNISAIKNVSLNYSDPAISKDEVKINSEKASYNSSSSLLNFEENVKISYGPIQAESDQADFLAGARKISLQGNCHATYEGNQLKGERLIVWLKENKVTIAGKSKIIIKEEEVL